MAKKQSTKLLLLHTHHCDQDKFYIYVKTKRKLGSGNWLYQITEVELSALEEHYNLKIDYEYPLSSLYEQCVVVERNGEIDSILSSEFDIADYYEVLTNKESGPVVYVKLTDTITIQHESNNKLVINCVTERDKEVALNIKALYPKDEYVDMSQLNLFNTDSMEINIENQNTYIRGCINKSLTLVECTLIKNVIFENVSGVLYGAHIDDSTIRDIDILLRNTTIHDSMLKGHRFKNVSVLDMRQHIRNEYVISNSIVTFSIVNNQKGYTYGSKLKLTDDVEQLKIWNSGTLELIYRTDIESGSLEVHKNIISYGISTNDSWIYLENNNNLENLLNDATFVYTIKMLSYPDGSTVKDTEIACINTNIRNNDRRWVAYLVTPRDALIPLEQAIVDGKIKGVSDEIIKYSNDSIISFLKLLKNNIN